VKRRDLLAAGTLAAAWPASPLADEPPRRIDWPAMTLLDGTAVPPAFWQGRAAIVVFWATWCPFCRAHNLHVDKLQASLDAASSDAPRVLGVALDADRALVARTVAERRYRFPVTVDDGTIRARFATRRVIPTTCLVDRRGLLVQTIPGEMFEEDVMDLPAILTRRRS
jgi:thiol-disulfide isomerase/thioredoxin